MKLIVLMTMMLLTSCSFEDHPKLLDDIKNLEKEAIDEIATDLKNQVDKQKVKDAKTSPPTITVPIK